MSLGGNIKTLLQMKGLSQADLAKRISVSNAVITSYVLDKSEPPIAALVAIANCLECSVDYLLGLTDISYSSKTNVYYSELPFIIQSGTDFDTNAKRLCYDIFALSDDKYSCCSEPVNHTMIYSNRISPESHHLLYVEDDSYAPSVYVNSLVLIKKGVAKVDNNSLYAVRFHKGDVVGLHLRYCQIFGNLIILTSADRKSEEVFNLDEIDFQPIAGEIAAVITLFQESGENLYNTE